MPGGSHDYESHRSHAGLDELNAKMQELHHPEAREAHEKETHKKHKGHESYSSTSASYNATFTAPYPGPTPAPAEFYASEPTAAYGPAPYGARRVVEARASANDVRTALQEIMKDVPDRLATICGGTPEDSPNGLPACSWEQAMKAYILTWP